MRRRSRERYIDEDYRPRRRLHETPRFNINSSEYADRHKEIGKICTKIFRNMDKDIDNVWKQTIFPWALTKVRRAVGEKDTMDFFQSVSNAWDDTFGRKKRKP